MTDLSTYDILNDIRNGKTPVKRQNPQPGESPYYYIQSNGDKSYLPITEKNIINVNSAEEPNPLWSSAFQKTTNTGSNEATQTSVADSVLSGTVDTPQTNSLGTNSTQTDNWGFNSVSSTNNTMSLFDTPQTMSSILGTSSTGSVNIESKWPKLYQAAREFNQQELCNNIARTTKDHPDMIERNAWGLNECL